MHLEGLGIFLQSSLIHSLLEYTKIDLEMALPSSPSMISESMSNKNSVFFLHKFIYFIFYLFHFWLHWVFVAARGLFSGCGERGLLFVAV